MTSAMNAKSVGNLFCLFMLLTSAVCADDARPKASSDPTRVLATVGDAPITFADVELSLGRAGSAQADLPPLPERLVMAAVDIIANQRRALLTLKKENKAVSEAEIDKWLTDNSPPDLKLTPEQALSARAEAARVSKSNYRQFLAFRLSWQAYLQQMVTDTNLEKHFNNQKSRFDGTRFQVEHVWKAAPPGTSEMRKAVHKELTAIRQKILDDQIDFPSAGKKLAGEEGEKMAAPLWLTGSGPLMPAIVDRVLAVPVGTISEPFDSSQAVHLVRVLAIEPGQRTYEEAKEDVRKHMPLFLLDYLAKSAQKELTLTWRDR